MRRSRFVPRSAATAVGLNSRLRSLMSSCVHRYRNAGFVVAMYVSAVPRARRHAAHSGSTFNFSPQLRFC